MIGWTRFDQAAPEETEGASLLVLWPECIPPFRRVRFVGGTWWGERGEAFDEMGEIFTHWALITEPAFQ